MPTVHCPSCQRALHLPEAEQGSTARCPLCQTTFPTPEVEPRRILPTPPPPVPVARAVPQSHPRPAAGDPSPFDFDDEGDSDPLNLEDRQALVSAARWLKVYAGLGMAHTFSCGCLFALAAAGAEHTFLTALLGPLVRFVLLCVVFSGGESMERRRSRRLAMTATILAILTSGYLLLASWLACVAVDHPPSRRRMLDDDPTFVSFSSLITLPVAVIGIVGCIKALNILMKPAVVRTFQRSR